MFAFLSTGTELRRFGKGTLPKIALVVLMFIPLIYGALYLWAFWAPDKELSKLPVALVNSDTGAVRDGTDVTAGNDLVGKLLDGHDLGWVETSAADAATGVTDGDYYFSVTIPADFSTDAISAGTDTPTAAEVLVDYNDSNSFLASTLGKQAMIQLRDAVSLNIGDQTVNTMLVAVNKAGDGIRTAAAGAGTLADGLSTAESGTGTLVAGLNDLSAGASTLDDGAAQVADGSSTLAAGISTLSSGAATLSSSSLKLSDGASTVAAGTQKVSDGLASAATGAATLSDFSDQLAEGATSIATGTGQLATGTKDLDDGLAKLEAAMAAAPAGTPASAFLPTVTKLATGADTLNTKTQGAATQVSGYATLSGNFATGMGTLSDALTAGAPGAAQVAAGSAQVASGSAALASGAGQLATGAATAATGSATLATGADSLAAGTGTLVDGSSQLVAGGTALQSGTVQLADGSHTLADALATGAADAPSLTDAQISEKAAVIANPVDLNQRWENASDSFGEGFAPFFLALATFVGALITWLILRALPTRALASAASGLRATMTGFLPAMAIGLSQVIIMVLVLVYGIGLTPAHWLGMSAFIYLTTLAFLALQQMFIILFGTAAGRVISLVLLMLQLSSSGGTYPVETTPEFFQILHPWMPASYVVTGLRQLITGGIDSRLWLSVLVLVGILVGSIAISAWSASRQRMWTITRLHPELTI
ncbi:MULTISPECIES: YhgE/Pip family protein [unclassified Cryobacterium]|uniref:YhgE/Pip family protein n=1 Tax=unclassified Cryobacterium TaxID=2649013 RepID=UPI00106D9205|nr:MULTISPECIES: YhgE/Pip domain-containing protein [unclassified Cryobacterium]TFB93764.1 YhgE/Pip domain-containing protein [Cryobacterium sp. MDB2-A-1]TFC09024.1 YhgE/Pip domain-containing protein [Cryobacterium sp. MDB2-33-2]TFC14804.1 YhgE/Pip domain-containing protein [Cryobacterium sp. MDB2-A-2]TFC16571.1 YhgE/Pip domain-containing protein [Cryobacterium sp. MDB2-10]